MSGTFFPGKRLKETDLALELGISRSPIREALKVVEQEGLIVVEPWKGLSIAKLTRVQMLELFSYREVFEVMAIEMACESITAERLDLLSELVDDHLLSDDVTLADLARNNQEFHQTIYEATQNDFLKASVGTLRTLLALMPSETFRQPGRTATILEEHRAIVGGLKARDTEMAKAAIRTHIRNSAKSHMSLIVKADLGI